MSSTTATSSISNAQTSFGSCEPATTTTAGLGESSLDQVAKRVGVAPDALRAANPQIANPDNLSFGQMVNVPAREVAAPPAPPPAPPPPPARRLEGLGVYQIDMKGGTRVVIERDVVGASRPPDAVVKMAKRGDEVIVSHELKRGPHYAMLLTRFEGTAGKMQSTQHLYRWDGRAKAWVDVTKEASRAGPLAVDWNMPQLPKGFTLPTAGETAKQMAAEMLLSEIPPSLVIPYVKDSILVEHFEFTPPGQHPYLHWNDTISRRWAATGERKTSYWFNKGVAVVGAAGSVASEINTAGRAMQTGTKAATVVTKVARGEQAVANATSQVAQDVAQDGSKLGKNGASKQLGSTDRAHWANTKPETPNPMAGREGVQREVTDINAARNAKKPTTPTDTPPAGGSSGKTVTVANDNEAIKAQKIAVGDTTGTDARKIRASNGKPPDSGPKGPSSGEPSILKDPPKTPEPAPAKPATGTAVGAAGDAATASKYGKWDPADVMARSKYKPTQRDLYKQTVEDMADLMKAKKFPWKSDVDPIILDANGKIMQGHHRIAAAELAKVPIPEDAIKRVPADTIRDTRTWGQVTVRPGLKPQ